MNSQRLQELTLRVKQARKTVGLRGVCLELIQEVQECWAVIHDMSQDKGGAACRLCEEKAGLVHQAKGILSVGGVLKAITARLGLVIRLLDRYMPLGTEFGALPSELERHSNDIKLVLWRAENTIRQAQTKPGGAE